MTTLTEEFITNVMEGYYQEHAQGFDLLQLDLAVIANHSVDVVVEKNKRIEYLEQREADLLVELENARSIIATLEEKIHNTHVTKD